MNIITIVDKNWFDTHLKRFMYFAVRNIPCAKFYLVIVVDYGDSTPQLPEPAQALFEGIIYVERNTTYALFLYYDMLRGSLLRMFGLTEALYVDADVDILRDISPLCTH